MYYLEWAGAECVSSAFSALSTDFYCLSDQIYLEYWACFYFDIAAPLPCPGDGIVKLPNQLRFMKNTHCLPLAICQDGLPCTGAKRDRLIEHARIRDLA